MCQEHNTVTKKHVLSKFPVYGLPQLNEDCFDSSR